MRDLLIGALLWTAAIIGTFILIWIAARLVTAAILKSIDERKDREQAKGTPPGIGTRRPR